LDPSFSDNYTYLFDKNLPLKDQILFSDRKFYLINVRLQYTNNLYFGVHWSVFYNNTITHLFKCKDRGFSESCFENLDNFLSSFKKKTDVFGSTKATHSQKKNFTFKKQKTHISSICGRDVDVFYAYEGDKYRYTSFQFTDDKSIIKGLYAPKKELFLTEGSDPFRVGYVCDEDKNPTSKDLDYLRDRTVISLSNVNTIINTEYSKIKIY